MPKPGSSLQHLLPSLFWASDSQSVKWEQEPPQIFPDSHMTPPLAAETPHAGIRRSRAPGKQSPRSLVQGHHSWWRPGRGEEMRKSQPLPAPMPRAQPGQSQQPSARQDPQPEARHIWAHQGLWRVEVASPGSDLWERKGSGVTLTGVLVPALPSQEL